MLLYNNDGLLVQEKLTNIKEDNAMKSEKILKAIPLMQELDDGSLDLILDAIKSCQAVQALSQSATF